MILEEDYLEESQDNDCDRCDYKDQCDGICHLAAFRLEEIREEWINIQKN